MSFLTDIDAINFAFKEKMEDHLQHEFVHIRQMYFADAVNGDGISD